MNKSSAHEPESDVKPYEARGLFPVLTDEGADALRDVVTAVNGFVYAGDRMDAIASTVAWLQTHPEARAVLFPPGQASDA